MRIHYLQHVPFEGLGSIENWAITRGHTLSLTRLYAGDPLPPLDHFELLVVMGGPMSIHDEADYPWLKAEKWFIQQVINSGKPILGICLGAQLLAETLGGKVAAAGFREIGWFPITLDQAFADSNLGQRLPDTIQAFHWHGETFTLPPGCHPLAASEACQNQGFICHDRIIGLQFHLESTRISTEALIENCADELDGSRWVQSADEILADDGRFLEVNRLMQVILLHLEEQVR